MIACKNCKYITFDNYTCMHSLCFITVPTFNYYNGMYSAEIQKRITDNNELNGEGKCPLYKFSIQAFLYSSIMKEPKMKRVF